MPADRDRSHRVAVRVKDFEGAIVATDREIRLNNALDNIVAEGHACRVNFCNDRCTPGALRSRVAA